MGFWGYGNYAFKLDGDMNLFKWFSIWEIIVVFLLTLIIYLFFYKILPLDWQETALVIVINFVLVKTFAGLYKLIKRWKKESPK